MIGVASYNSLINIIKKKDNFNLKINSVISSKQRFMLHCIMISM